MFRLLTAEQRQRIVSTGLPLVVPAGQILGQADQEPSYLYVIASGEAQLVYESELGPIPVRVATRNGSFPWTALRGWGNLVTTCSALTDMEVIAFPIDDLNRAIEEDPELGVNIYKAITDLLASQYHSTLELLARNALREASSMDD